MRLHDLIREYTTQTEDGGVDVFFFRVKLARELTAEEIEELKNLLGSYKGDFADVDLFDNEEHSYLEVGAWIGDQGMALRLLALGELLKFWRVMQPRMLPIPEELAKRMAGQGMVSLLPYEEEITT